MNWATNVDRLFWYNELMGEDYTILIEALQSAQRIGVLTGAGVSTLSGIPDFRGPKGLYAQPGAERIFDIDWFDRDPSVYYKGCQELVYGLDRFQPNAVHYALAKLEAEGRLAGIATQNIDMLHQKAGSKAVYEIHGSPLVHHCRRCGQAKPFDEILGMLRSGVDIPRCQCGGVFKPDITFFGEMLPERALASAEELARTSDVFLVLGTSLSVFPAANLPRLALSSGAKLFIVNAQPTSLDELATAVYKDLASFAEVVQVVSCSLVKGLMQRH